MNEQLRRFADRACEYADYDPGFIPDEFLEKFAELIILESKCWIHKRIGPKTALDFLEHFGVEE